MALFRVSPHLTEREGDSLTESQPEELWDVRIGAGRQRTATPGLSDEETLVKCPVEDMARKCYLIISKTASSTLALVGVTVAVKFTEVAILLE